jgi:hypothetical protein
MFSPRIVRILACFWLVATVTNPARAEPEPVKGLPDVIKSAAEEVLKLVNGKTLSIGLVSPTAQADSNGGPAIGVLLRQELERLKPGVVVEKGAPVELNGTFVFGPHPDAAEAGQGQKAIKLILRIVDTQTGEDTPLRLSRFFLQDNATIARVLQPSGHVPEGPSGDQVGQRRERNKSIQELVEKPGLFIDPVRPSLVSTSPESPYKVEVVACPIGDGTIRPTEPREARLNEKRLAVIDLNKDEVYEIYIHNSSPEEIAARVFIDGIDIYQFSDDRDPEDSTKPKFAYSIIPGRPRGQTESVAAIIGWHKRVVGPDNFLAFLVTSYGKGASTKGVKAQGDVGVIQVQFSKTKPLPDDGKFKLPGIETGFGPPRQGEVKPVVREILPFIDAVSIRYAH